MYVQNKYSCRGERLLNINAECINVSYFDNFIWKFVVNQYVETCFIMSYKEYLTE